MSKLTAAVVQTAPSPAGTDVTVDKVVDLIARCGELGADVAVFPEALIGGYPKGANFNIYIGARTPEGREEYFNYHGSAIDVPGSATAALGEAARQAKLYLTIGVIERDGGTLYCTALYFGPDGRLLGKHRKLMPTAAERLCWGFGDGSTLSTVPTPFGPMGAVICWENYMPMVRMAMYAQGIALYCAPTADDRPTWTATMQHVALEGRCFVLSACQHLRRRDLPETFANRITDEPDKILMRGGSLIVSPLGQVLAGPVFDEDAILTTELDLDDIPRGKFDFDVVGHYARPDVFNLKVDTTARRAVSEDAQ